MMAAPYARSPHGGGDTLMIWRWQGKARGIKALTRPPALPPKPHTMLTPLFKAWRNPRTSVRFFSFVLQVVHASPCPGFRGCPSVGSAARNVLRLRDQTKDPRDRILRKAAPGYFGHLHGFDRRLGTHRL